MLTWRRIATYLGLAVVFTFVVACEAEAEAKPQVVIEVRGEARQWNDWTSRKPHTYDFVANAQIQDSELGEVLPWTIQLEVEVAGTRHPMDGYGAGDWEVSVTNFDAYCNGEMGFDIFVDYTWAELPDLLDLHFDGSSTLTVMAITIPRTADDIVVHTDPSLVNASSELAFWRPIGIFGVFNWSDSPVNVTDVEVVNTGPNTIQLVNLPAFPVTLEGCGDDLLIRADCDGDVLGSAEVKVHTSHPDYGLLTRTAWCTWLEG